jgi:hypothetical protein
MNFFITLLAVALAMPSVESIDDGAACQIAFERVIDAATEGTLCEQKDLADAAIAACAASSPMNQAAVDVIRDTMARC